MGEFNIMEHNPFGEFRDYQEQVIKVSIKLFEDYDYLVVEAPTGVGKSLIAKVLSSYYKSSYITTSQKALQAQYVDSFHLTEMKGKSNYICNKNPKKTADKASCKGCLLFSNCNYNKALSRAIEAKTTVLNYHIALMQPKFNEVQRKLLICDECHNIEDIFMSYVSFTISDYKLKSLGLDCRVPEKVSNDEVKIWVENSLINAIEERINDIQSKYETMFDAEDIDEEDEEIIQELNEYETKINRFLGTFNTVKWIYCEDEKQFKPLKINTFTNKLFSMGNKVLLMSATVLDADSYCESLGIPKDKVKLIKVPSPFPLSNRKIHLDYCSVNLTYKNRDQGMIDLVEVVKKIMDLHPNEKGIIHTHTYRIANFLCNAINSDRLLLSDAQTKDSILEYHAKTSKPTILISPSMTEGVDLKDDLARFGVICKIPYPFLGDKQIKERSNVDKDWFAWRTCLDLVQAYGRTVRSKEDWAKTYILDQSFKWFIKSNKNILPKWFLDAVI